MNRRFSGLSLTEADRLEAEEKAKGNLYDIRLDSSSKTFYLLPKGTRTSKSIWDVILKTGAGNESKRPNRHFTVISS